MAHVKLHILGPVEVSSKTFQAMTRPMIGHRGQGFKDLYAGIQPRLQTLLQTQQLVYLSTSSAWGVMEGALTNLTSKKVVNCLCGAFSDTKGRRIMIVFLLRARRTGIHFLDLLVSDFGHMNRRIFSLAELAPHKLRLGIGPSPWQVKKTGITLSLF